MITVQLHEHNRRRKKELFTNFGGDNTNTGSTEGQIALFTHRINHLTERQDGAKKIIHLEGLLKLVGKRRRLLNYLMKNDIEKYRVLIKELGIRK